MADATVNEAQRNAAQRATQPKSSCAIALSLVLALFTVSPAFAQDAPSDAEMAQAAAETRQGLFKVIVSYFGPVVAMARQQMPYDGDLVAANAAKIATLAPMIPDVFRRDTRAFDLDTEARDAIWEDADAFAAKASTLAEKAAALAAAAGVGQDQAMAAFRETGGACKGCHDDYRDQD